MAIRGSTGTDRNLLRPAYKLRVVTRVRTTWATGVHSHPTRVVRTWRWDPVRYWYLLLLLLLLCLPLLLRLLLGLRGRRLRGGSFGILLLCLRCFLLR